MIEVLQFLFATAKDQNLYFNQDGLIKELLTEYQFSQSEVQDALDWFAPILNCTQDLEINSESIRSISNWEAKYLPTAIIKQIMAWERNKTINFIQREILLDRLGELGLDWQIDAEEMQEILDGLIYHLQHYKYNLVSTEISQSPYYWAHNFTVH